MYIKVVIWLTVCYTLLGKCEGSWSPAPIVTDPDPFRFNTDDPKIDLEPTTPSTTSSSSSSTSTSTTTTTPTTTTTTTPTTTTTTTPTTTTTTTPTTTTTTTTTTTPTTTTTTTPTTTTTTTPTTTTTTTPTTTTTTPTTTTTTTPTTTTTTTPTTTTTTTPTTTTTTTTTTTPTTTTPLVKDCVIELDNECLEPEQLLWVLPETKEFLIFRIRLRNALILDKQAKLFLLQIPHEEEEEDEETACVLDTSNGSEGHNCPFELKKLLGFWRNWNELCVVVFPKLQNVTYASCERRVDCCGSGTKCAAAGFVRNAYLVYCDRYYPYEHSFVDGRTPDVIKSDLLLHGDHSITDIPTYELDHVSNNALGEFYVRHDYFPQGCNCLEKSCKKYRYGVE